MDYDSQKKLLDIMIENSARILRADFGVNSAEASFFSVVALLKGNPELKIYFISRCEHTFKLIEPSSLDEGVVPQELIELVAHEMRWEEIKNLSERRVCELFNGDWERACGDISRRIIDAFSDEWKDREFYKKYS